MMWGCACALDIQSDIGSGYARLFDSFATASSDNRHFISTFSGDVVNEDPVSLTFSMKETNDITTISITIIFYEKNLFRRCFLFVFSKAKV